MKSVTFPYSQFLRGPSEVLPELETADVVLERRGGEVNLLLTSVSRAEARAAGMALSARLMADFASEHPGSMVDYFVRELPWMSWLPEDDRELATRELLAELMAGASTGLLDSFARAVKEWRETAEIWSDPELARRLRGPFPGDGPEVSRPESTASA